MSDAPRIERAGPGDAAAIAALLRAAFAGFEPLYTPGGFAATTPPAEAIRARLAEGPCWIARLEGEPVGTVAAVPRGGALYVRSMAVAPAARGRGIGERLLACCEAHARAEHLREIELVTTPFLDAAIRLYERCGFVREGDPGDLHGTPLIALRKRLEG